MKKAVAILVFISMGFLAGCVRDGEEPIPDLPAITSTELLFVENAGNNTSGFRLTFEFTDGDFDFGLTPDDDTAPYHAYDFFVSDNNSQARIASTTELFSPQTADHFLFVQPSSAQTGKLLTFEQLKKQNKTLEFSCAEFTTQSVGVKTSDLERIFNTSRIVNTVSSSVGEIFILKDSFRVEQNKFHYNIHVTYFVEQANGSFEEIAFEKEFCHPGFNGRIPEIFGMNGSTGQFDVKTLSNHKMRVSYNMPSVAFRPVYGGKRMKLRVSIIDRSLNESAVVETEPVLVPKP